ncbi:MAG: S1/P1 Nuclease [Caulobacteraceae bacterium]|nr:S1/P1 Nuclease [Caulobacteraceae bacterium]
MRGWLVSALGLVIAAHAAGAYAWGASGHRMIGEAAIESLPDEIPAFLRTPAAAAEVGELSREPDRSRGAGKAHDADRDPGHFVDAGDDGRIGGAVSLSNLPPTREAYETALRASGGTSWKLGYLPYSIVEDWQQLAEDFAYWRADAAAARHAADPARKAWLEADRARREGLILADLGALSHFVGDGSMPLHASVHFNGWGDFPNPQGYTQDRVHTPFEGAFVRQFVALADVRTRMRPFRDCGCPMEARVGAYLADDLASVIPFYELQKAGGLAGRDPKGRDFAAAQLAAGASELRDETVLAWRASEAMTVGWPAVEVRAIEAGGIDPYDSLAGQD